MLLEGIKKRHGVNGRQEAERQEKGRGWGFGGEPDCSSQRGGAGAAGNGWGSGCRGNRWEERQMGD